jgi:titin
LFPSGSGRFAIVALGLAVFFAVSAGRASAGIYTVFNTNDSVLGSLRAAILNANANPGSDLINFSLPYGAQITPVTSLPALTGQVAIDATVPAPFKAPGMIVLDGSTAGGTGLQFLAGSSSSSVRGLDLVHWSTAIELAAVTSVGIGGNYIGTDLSGSAAAANGTGILIHGGASGNGIGGVTTASRNVISGNSGIGIDIEDPGTNSNIVLGNYIGTDASGTAALGNDDGVVVAGGTGNAIRGTSAATRNVISANGGGIFIEGPGTDGTIVQGNYIGTNASGTAALGNSSDGVFVCGSCISTGTLTGTVIGGTSSANRNVISGNGGIGVDILSAGTNGTIVRGNYIGTNASGTAALGNSEGMFICGCGFGPGDLTGTIVGGTASGAGNVISGSDGIGVFVCGCGGPHGTSGGTFQGNRIGTNAAGTAALGNEDEGIELCGCAGAGGGLSGYTIGGTTAGARNVISGNGHVGVGICGCGGGAGAGADSNVISGNYIGTDASGTHAIGNHHGGFGGTYGAGVELCGCGGPGGGATNNTIGGTAAGAGNLIAGNVGAQVDITGFGSGTGNSTGNLVQHNTISSNFDGSLGICTICDGVLLEGGAYGNTIGGTTSAAANTIAHNGTDGVHVDGLTNGPTNDNAILGNSIFSNFSFLGIHLTNSGNDSQPAPVITSVSTGGGLTTISGTVSGAGTLRIEVFANPSCSDPEGKTFLGFVSTATGTWTKVVPALPPGSGVTATSTSSTNDTSQFSACQTS